MGAEEQMRKEFEEWVKNPHMLNRRTEPGYTHEYEHPWTSGAWEAWKALWAPQTLLMSAERARCVMLCEQMADQMKAMDESAVEWQLRELAKQMRIGSTAPA